MIATTESGNTHAALSFVQLAEHLCVTTHRAPLDRRVLRLVDVTVEYDDNEPCAILATVDGDDLTVEITHGRDYLRQPVAAIRVTNDRGREVADNYALWPTDKRSTARLMDAIHAALADAFPV